MGRRIQGEGPVPCRVMFIGERPGKDEDRMGRPFVGLAGVELNRYFDAGGLKREQIYITNLVKDYRDGDKPTQEEIERDAPELWAEIAACAPDVLVLAGAYAIHTFMGSNWNVEDVHGCPYDSGFGPTFWPMYHPAAGFYDATVQPNILDDIKRLGSFLRGELSAPIDSYRGNESYVARELARKSSGWGAPPVYGTQAGIDTEGYRDSPWCATVSWLPGSSEWYGAEEDYDELATILSKRYSSDSSFRVYLHNSLHDLSVLRSIGINLPDGGFVDTMVLSYLLCLEPQGLKQLARRHLGMEMQSYEDIVGPYDQDKCMEYLLAVDAGEWGKVEEYIIIEAGKSKIKKPQSLGQRVHRILADYEKRPDIDLRARWGKIADFIREPAEHLLGGLPQADLSDVPTDIARHYACRDSDATLRLAPILETMVYEAGLGEVAHIDHGIVPMVDRMQHVGMPCSEPDRFAVLEAKCDDIMAKCRYSIYRITGATVNPDSPDQVRELLFGQLKLPVGRLTKINKEASTDDKTLEGLRSAHPVIPAILDYREASKVRNSFARAIPRHIEEGRIHPNLRITRVSSGRLAANSPNLLAIPVRSDLGKAVRDCFGAPPGHTLGSHDLDQIEMRLMMAESEDEYGCKLFREGKVDIHRQTASLMFGVPYDLVLPMAHRYPAKRVGFGIITGITGHGLVDQMALGNATKVGGASWTEEDCDKLIIEWFKIYKRVRPYMDRCRAEARRHGLVRCRWGRIRYLPGAQSPIAKVREEALRQSHSHKIQAGAQGIIKIAMRHMWQDIKFLWNAGYWIEPLLQIHDEVIVELEDDPALVQLWDEMAVHRLTTSVDIGIPLKAKGSFNPEWGKLKD